MRTLMTFLSFAAVIYAGMGILLYLFQGRLVFLANIPGRALTARPTDIGLRFEDVTIATADRQRLHGWYVPASEDGAGIDLPGCAPMETKPESKPPGKVYAEPVVVLFLHGNAGNIGQRLDSLAIFHALGLDTLIFDYRGYGHSSGSPSEKGTYNDAEAAWRYLTEQRDIAPERIVLFGRSLGGAIGAWLGGRVQPAGVIIESCFASGVDMGRRMYPYLPMRLITRLRYPVVDYVRALKSPLLVVHSRDDEIVPFEMGRRIFEAAPEPKSFLELRGDHNSAFVQNCDAYMAGLKEYLHGVGTERGWSSAAAGRAGQVTQ